MLLSIQDYHDIKMGRLYGFSMQHKDFPFPGKEISRKRLQRDGRPDTDLQNITLHHLIRRSENSTEILEFDRKFKDPRYVPTMTEVRKYKKIITDAIIKEIKKLDVIFCTSSVATNTSFLRGISEDVFQLIIDEAGMCTEPETIVPIIATRAKQVVLIGDHKQLRPVISSTDAETMGLAISLFERYAENKKADNMLTLLREQYRMVNLVLFKANLHLI